MITHGFKVEQVGEIIKAVTPQLSSELDKNSKKLEKDFGELDCISRADAIRVASGYCHPSNVAKELAKLPSVTPQPRKGHWIVAKGSYLGMRNACCSNCKDFYTNDWNVMNYCPNCGADMREVEE
jgi:hypothetical protein